MTFAVGSASGLPHSDGEFDLAYLRGVLHHMDRPIDALAEALRLAPLIVVVEPNGYNPGLKLLERVSRYHREHGEKSYAPRRLDRWVESVGGTVVARRSRLRPDVQPGPVRPRRQDARAGDRAPTGRARGDVRPVRLHCQSRLIDS